MFGTFPLKFGYCPFVSIRPDLVLARLAEKKCKQELFPLGEGGQGDVRMAYGYISMFGTVHKMFWIGIWRA